jgi:hypothetical protein
MKRSASVCASLSLFLLLAIPKNVKAQGNAIVLPAGTLIHCSLDEPNFSSKTAEVGDPVVCPLGGLILFNRNVFPRGAYLGGHLEAVKDPGRFFGKGYLQLEFDKIGMPNDQVPVPTKVIAASGYKVDAQGKIDGHGHAERDTVEWMLPPLWPYKVITLPERGPRPVLKGEERLTLRLMDDIAIPQQAMPGWHFFGDPSSQNLPSRNEAVPSRYALPQAPAVAATAAVAIAANNVQRPAVASAAVAPTSAVSDAPSGAAAGSAGSIVVLLNGTTYVATAAWIDGNQLSYKLANGSSGAASLNAVDWSKTMQTNATNGSALALNTESAER